ncbi:MAG: helix-turn-helix transcriptional regulator [Spirochaetota bacterium]|nr:helix-turn-helix transcriptional regulator [Spirochaetota bacterium]
MIGARIREKRKERKLNQEQLAELVGVVRQTVSSWENGNFEPDRKNLAKIALALGTPTGYFLEETDDFAPAPDRVAAAPRLRTFREALDGSLHALTSEDKAAIVEFLRRRMAEEE